MAFCLRSCLLWQGRSWAALLLFGELIPADAGLWDSCPGFLLMALPTSASGIWRLSECSWEAEEIHLEVDKLEPAPSVSNV